ncbi:PSB6 [Hepatospora eriocheir]|uniref:PSB6 n=1 Tax=Hepatospora eriocheir TaxID=1081669 RepID=A0A1X0QGI9_9MICR|nr:PSB6 [Hepatospora eriocheir]
MERNFKRFNVRREKVTKRYENERAMPFSKEQMTYLTNDKCSLLSMKDTQIEMAGGINKVQAKEEDLYEMNGGTTIAIIVDNKLIIAADTRHSGDYNINSRYSSKIHKIKDFYFTCVGFQADGEEVYKKLLYNVKKHEQYGEINIKSTAKLLSNILYSRRFFPYYSYCVLAGYLINDKGEKEAKIYSYDVVGSYGSSMCQVEGSGAPMIQPLLDSWIDGKNFYNFSSISFENAIKLIKAAFNSAAETDVKTGDYLELIIDDGLEQTKELHELRKD